MKEADARKATAELLSLSLFRSLSSLRRVRDEKDAEKSDAAVAACDVYTRIACIHFSPLPLSFFLLLSLLSSSGSF